MREAAPTGHNCTHGWTFLTLISARAGHQHFYGPAAPEAAHTISSRHACLSYEGALRLPSLCVPVGAAPSPAAAASRVVVVVGSAAVESALGWGWGHGIVSP